jgi:uncharacterized protein YheU (UPF0270 family)
MVNSLELKNTLISMVAETDDPDTLRQIIAFLSVLRGKTDWWEHLSDAEKARVEKARMQMEAGQVVAHEFVRAEVKKIFEN